MARQYRRSSNGKFAGGASTVKQDRAGHQKVKRDEKKGLNLSAGTRKKKRPAAKNKAKGRVVKTKQARNSAARARKRIG